MAAYAALVSLQQTLGIILDSGGLRILEHRSQLQRLGEQVNLSLAFLDNYSGSGGPIPKTLETKMRKAAYEAEDLIESEINRSFRKLMIIMFCNLICAVLVSLFVSSCVRIQRFTVRFLASVAICMIHDAVMLMHLALDARNQLEAGEFHRLSHYFDVIKTDMNRISEGGAEQQAAQAELTLLRETLDPVLASGSGRFISDNCRDQLNSLSDQVCPWLNFLENNNASSTDHAADIRAAASNAKAFIETEFSAHRSIWRSFCDLVKVSLLASWFYLPALALLTIIMVTFINNELPFATSPHAIRVFTQLASRWLTTLALGIGVHVLGTSGGKAVFLAMAAVANRSTSVEHNLSLVIDSLRSIMSQAIQHPGRPQAASSPRRDSEGRNDLVGHESDILDIKNVLHSDYSQLRVISIVGMGGIGKTTLARRVYNDAGTADHFDIRAWVTISQKYTLRHVLQRLLDSINIPTIRSPNDDEPTLGVHFHQVLHKRRFLIVIDDLWGTEVSDFVRASCPEDENGSRILLTSRWSPVTCSDPGRSRHVVQCLNEADSWALLQKTVFGGDTCSTELETIGRAIAQGCRGHPLSIVVIGRVLSEDKRREIWIDVKEKLRNSQLRQIREQCLDILGLSYNRLPHHLRPCFLYMGVFPGDSHEIPVSKLISLWAAEGFLKPCQDKSWEEVAEKYLEDLIEQNLILVCNRSCNGKIRTCSIHDLWRDFCVQTAYRENFLHVVDSGDITGEMPNQTPRRLSIRPDVQQFDASSRYLRSFLCSSDKLLNYPSVGFSKFWYLRVLDVLVVRSEAFPDQVIELVSLRYLALSCDDPLPPSLSKLGYLETLVHHHCSYHKYHFLPRVIWSMPKLRHLYVKPGCYLSNPLGYRLPWSSSTVVQHLQTLMGVRNLRWSQGIIERIPNLKKLGVSYDAPPSGNWSEYQLESLVNLHQLEILKITYYYDGSGSDNLPKPAFPPNLKKLSLCGGGIPWEDMKMIGETLPNLEALKLRCNACSGTSWIVEGEFPNLIFLLLEQLDFRWWITNCDSHFPRLQHLVIRSCETLEEIPNDIGYTLESIQLVGCHSSAEDSAKQIQQDQKSMGNEDIKLRIC